MASLDDIEFRTVIDDVRSRHAAILALINTTETQAMSLLRLFITLGIAAGSGIAAGFGQSAIITRPVTFALIGGAVVFVAGAGCCLLAMRPGVVNLPGRDPAFWKWAMLPGVERAAVLTAYLNKLDEKRPMMDAFNKRTATAFKWAKLCTVLAPVAAILLGTAATYLRF